MKFILNIIALGMLCFPLAGCGKSESVTVPQGSAITFNPAEFTVTDGSIQTTWFTRPLTITVLDENGNPLNKAKINIYFPFALPNTPAYVQLYDGSLAKPMNVPFDTYTDDFGVCNLIVGFQSGGGLEYTGDLEARSGTAFAQIKITIN
jgi:hypothetical protein